MNQLDYAVFSQIARERAELAARPVTRAPRRRLRLPALSLRGRPAVALRPCPTC